MSRTIVLGLLLCFVSVVCAKKKRATFTNLGTQIITLWKQKGQTISAFLTLVPGQTSTHEVYHSKLLATPFIPSINVHTCYEITVPTQAHNTIVLADNGYTIGQ